MTDFMFDSMEMQVLKNFSTINQSLVIMADKFYTRNQAGNMIGIYRFKTPYDYPKFGIYETSELLALLGAYKTPMIAVHEKYLVITENNSKVKYHHTVIELINGYFIKVKGEVTDPYDEDRKLYRTEYMFDQVECELNFTFPQEKLTMLLKMASLLKAEQLFFETIYRVGSEPTIRVTIGNKLDGCTNTWDLELTEGIATNELTTIMATNVSELKLLSSDYQVRVSSKGISKWESPMGVTYYIGMKATSI